MPPATPAKADCKYKTHVTELQLTLTNPLLPQPPPCKTDFLQLDSRCSVLSFNSSGAELRATNKIRPINAPTAVSDFGGIKKLDFL